MMLWSLTAVLVVMAGIPRAAAQEAIAVREEVAQTRAALPLENVLALWNMADTAGHLGERSRLTIEGNVKLGIPLAGPERAASLDRGGDRLFFFVNHGEVTFEAIRIMPLNPR